MKNRLTKLTIFLAALIIFTACNKNDGYSLGAFQISVATVHKIDNHSYSLTLDNGKKLWPAAYNVKYNPKDSQRVFVNYTLLSDQYGIYDHMIKVNDMWKILTKDIVEITSENEAEIGSDPIRINNMWIASDFLSIGFKFNYGGVRPHHVNLVKSQVVQNQDGEETIELEFRHNTFGTGTNNLNHLWDGLASFDLKPLRRNDIDSIKLKVTYKDFPRDGDPILERSHELYYKYNSLQAESKQLGAPLMVVSNDEYY